MQGLLIRWENMNKFVNNVDNYKQISDPIITRGIWKLALDITARAKTLTPVDTGFLRSSYVNIFEDKKATIWPQANYAAFVHEGTKFMQGTPFLTAAAFGGHGRIGNTADYRDMKEFEKDLDKILKKISVQ